MTSKLIIIWMPAAWIVQVSHKLNFQGQARYSRRSLLIQLRRQVYL